MSYEAQNITVLEGLEAVRKRPGMYIGTTSERGLHHLVWEIVDNSVDEALAGYCNKIDVKILPDNIIEVVDNGRGIPTDIHPKYGKSALEIVLTVLHAGGKFENDNYKVSGGLHGVGVSVVNALSEWLEVEVRKEGNVYYQKYHRGKPEEDVKIIGSCEANEHGTTVRFKADGDIFETLVYNYFTLSNRLKELAYLNRGLTITLSDLRKEEKKEEVLAVIDTTQGDIANIKLLREAYGLNLLDAKNLWEHIKPSVLESMDFSNVKEIVDYSQGDIANIKIIKDYYKIDLKTAKELWDSIREQENQ